MLIPDTCPVMSLFRFRVKPMSGVNICVPEILVRAPILWDSSFLKKVMAFMLRKLYLHTQKLCIRIGSNSSAYCWAVEEEKWGTISEDNWQQKRSANILSKIDNEGHGMFLLHSVFICNIHFSCLIKQYNHTFFHLKKCLMSFSSTFYIRVKPWIYMLW